MQQASWKNDGFRLESPNPWPLGDKEFVKAVTGEAVDMAAGVCAQWGLIAFQGCTGKAFPEALRLKSEE